MAWTRKPKNIDNLVFETSEEVFATVENFLKDFDYETATEILTREINNNPDDLEYRKKRVEVMFEQHNDFEHYADGGIDDLIYILRPVKNINYEYILSDCSEILKIQKLEYYYFIRATISEKFNAFEQSIADFSECIKFNPYNMQYQLALAKAYEKTNQSLNAIKVYDFIMDNYEKMQNLNLLSKYSWNFGYLNDIYIKKFHLHEKLGNEEAAFEDLFMIIENEIGIYSDSIFDMFLKYCYKLKKYELALKHIENKNPPARHFLIPFIYKKLGKYENEKQYYIDFLKQKPLLLREKSRYLRNYRYLIRLEKNCFRRFRYTFLYHFDKHFLYRLLKFFDKIKVFISLNYFNDYVV